MLNETFSVIFKHCVIWKSYWRSITRESIRRQASNKKIPQTWKTGIENHMLSHFGHKLDFQYCVQLDMNLSQYYEWDQNVQKVFILGINVGISFLRVQNIIHHFGHFGNIFLTFEKKSFLGWDSNL